MPTKGGFPLTTPSDQKPPVPPDTRFGIGGRVMSTRGFKGGGERRGKIWAIAFYCLRCRGLQQLVVNIDSMPVWERCQCCNELQPFQAYHILMMVWPPLRPEEGK